MELEVIENFLVSKNLIIMNKSMLVQLMNERNDKDKFKALQKKALAVSEVKKLGFFGDKISVETIYNKIKKGDIPAHAVLKSSTGRIKILTSYLAKL
jgi:hypothetical protein